MTISARPTPWHDVLLLCGKCSRKLDGGFGEDGDETLRTALRDALREAGAKRRVRVMETRCMGLCPKKAVAALNASRPGRLLTVPKGTAAEAALEALIGELPGP